MVANRCLLCGETNGHQHVADGLLRRCGSCQFVWTADSLPPPEELYDRTYYETDGYQNYFTSARQRRFESARRLRWLLSAVRPTSLLEAGPAGGYFLEAAQRKGITVSGVEVSEVAARFARDELGVPVRQGCFEESVHAEPVQAVCAFHVLEHVEDPRRFIETARAALVPEGWLALEVPNIASAAARRLGSAWPAIAPAYHRWHFTPESLTHLLHESGFRVVRHDTVFSRYYWQPLARLAHARNLLIPDWVASGSPRMSHPYLGDLLRVFARPAGPRGAR
ncbi:class I SAM-dependent methyltransferase [Micromonospora sp. NPDC050417]|uniref:class I SAM-dependent methyltransferase n=1 Tax=Micromonospora sp. NPDC050417 TaxID=3364280 RepID=UPI003795465F